MLIQYVVLQSIPRNPTPHLRPDYHFSAPPLFHVVLASQYSCCLLTMNQHLYRLTCVSLNPVCFIDTGSPDAAYGEMLGYTHQ